MAAVEGYSTVQVCALLGLTPRQVDYWYRTDFIKPSVGPARGTGSARRYSFTDLVQLKTAGQLKAGGVSVQTTRQALEYLRERYPDLTHPLVQLRLLAVDGQFYVAHAAKEIENLRRRGQFILEVCTGKLAIELHGRVTELQEQQTEIDRWIDVQPDIQGGAPVVKGTRIPVKTVARYLRAGYTPEEICDDLPSLTKEAIAAVRDYHEGRRGRPITPRQQAKAA